MIREMVARWMQRLFLALQDRMQRCAETWSARAMRWRRRQ